MVTHLLYHSSIRLNLREFPLKCVTHFLGLVPQGGHRLLQGEDAVSCLVGFPLQQGDLLGVGYRKRHSQRGRAQPESFWVHWNRELVETGSFYKGPKSITSCPRVLPPIAPESCFYVHGSIPPSHISKSLGNYNTPLGGEPTNTSFGTSQVALAAGAKKSPWSLKSSYSEMPQRSSRKESACRDHRQLNWYLQDPL